MADENERYRFPKMLNQPQRLFGMKIEEAVLLLVPMAVGFWFKFYITGLITGAVLFYIIRFLKKGKPASYLYNAVYWYLPYYSKGIAYKKIPRSHLRHWIK